MALKTLHTAAAVLGIAVLGALAWWWQNPAPVNNAVAANRPASAPPAGGRGATGGPGAGGGPAPVEVGRVETLRLVDDASAVGSLRSRQGVMLRPEVSGRVSKVSFENGQRVRRGALMIQLDDTLQRAQLQQAEAQASIARTNLQRSRELLAQSFISQSAVDQNQAALQVAEAQVALAQAQLQRMQVLAPFDATTGIRLINVGDYVKDGADLVNVEDMSSMAVDFRLPERYLPRVRSGLPVEVAVDAIPDRVFKGQVDAVDSQVDANGRSLLVRARVENPGGVLRPGMFARPRLVFAVREAALVVPEEALAPVGSKQFVFKVVDGDKGKLSRRVEVSTGLRLPGKVEVLSGLAPGDIIVTAGQARLMRGENLPVRVIDLDRLGEARGKGGPAGRSGPSASGAAAGGASGASGNRGAGAPGA